MSRIEMRELSICVSSIYAQMDDTENLRKHWPCAVKTNFPGQHIRPGSIYIYIYIYIYSFFYHIITNNVLQFEFSNSGGSCWFYRSCFIVVGDDLQSHKHKK